MELNYSAITNSTVYASSKKLFEFTGKQKSKVIIWFFVGIFVTITVLNMVPILTPVVVIGVLATAVIGLYKLTKKGAGEWKISQKALSDFAAQNSFTYQVAPYMQFNGKNLPNINLTLPFKSKLETNSGYMTGSFHSLPFEYISGSIELIDYKGLSGQSGSQETRSLTALYITLPLVLPKLYIDTKRNNITGFEAKANNIDDLQEYHLEADFPEYYRIYAQKDDQINVLSILTPEVMQKLLERKYYDLWIDGDKLVVFALASPFEYFAGIPEVFPTAEMLLREIDKIERSLRHVA